MNLWLLLLLVLSFSFILLMFTPIRYELGFANHSNFNLYATIGQGFFFLLTLEKTAGRFDYKLRVLNIPCSLPRDSRNSEDNKSKEYRPGSSSPLTLLGNLLHNKTYQPLLKLIRKLWHHGKPQRLQIKGQYGFNEPHNTSWANILLLLLSSDSPHYQIELDPVWDEEKFDMEAFLNGSITLAVVFWHLLVFLFSPPFWKFFMELSQVRKNQKIKCDRREHQLCPTGRFP
ncbi:DUF2953 domain-containing protein [Syntrophomonas wolfei]|jgi:hypothetical protein|uniref:DUF2953 domain-containing protein n=1 Tax=Syntrophomonas wolfei subsp. wolfei (strain DSM 2245B / Goettingen) TaxID=335541 RepID=Q0AVQ2_SYNWW|nr:hypothetical protein [Syntrophomonas wolfei]ABI69202.1 hypothetical protein Swol_1905 [Syntrophomonas wolfei subsp. wolfei str. Goettingen G311]